jgi:large subunit ribosomal protein L3
MKFILAKKLQMSQVFLPDSTVVPVTLVQAGPCVVTSIKKEDGKDGYNAVQLGFLNAKRLNKPEEGHLKDLPKVKIIREFRIEDSGELKRGDMVESTTFAAGDVIQVTGTSKGKGFQGVVKRHHFHGHPSTHGHKDQLRMPGSIGPGGLQHVMKGRRMGGHMGDETVTVKNLKVMELRENGILAIKGAVPGARNAILMLQTA